MSEFLNVEGKDRIRSTSEAVAMNWETGWELKILCLSG